jgi:serine/threonine-protein kinase HipA
MITTAYINLWSERVGAVAWDANTKIASFEYDPKFITNNWEVAPLKMPLNQTNRIFLFPI